MMKYQKTKIKKISLIIAIVLIILSTVIGIIVYFNQNNESQVDLYSDRIINNNYFNIITVDFTKREIERDDIETNLQKEFNITEEKENLLLASEIELQSFFADTAFEVDIKNNIANITNKYQTKRIIIEAKYIAQDFNAKKVEKLENDIYVLEFDTQKQTMYAYEYLKSATWKKNIELDEVLYIDPINDESQTVYGVQNEQEESKYNSYGIKAMGLANFKNIIQQNGNPYEIIVSTLGYGVRAEHQYFSGRINDNYYNFMNDSKDISETIPQGSRVAEVIKDATPDNVKILPIVVVNNEGYTTISVILKAIEYAIRNSDIICYELVHNQSYMIDLLLNNAYEQNKPFCCVTTAIEQDVKKMYPANSSTTIAVSSIDKNNKITTYSGRGDFIDFTAHSTDIEEIFDKNSAVSKWSGAQYSNAHIAAAISLVKSYHKDFTILQVYNILKSYCNDLGDRGKDKLYGYGYPDFSKLTIDEIDRVAPEIKEIKFDKEIWEKTKQIQIIASDNIRVFEWAVTTSSEKPTEWNKIEEVKPTLDIIHEITENNIYYVWVKDSANNMSFMQIDVNRVDNQAPVISEFIDTSALEQDGYITITVSAVDNESGLHEIPYSWDGQNWGKENNILKVTENGRYKVFVKDALDNVLEKEIIVDAFPEDGIANINEGRIIKAIKVSSDWYGNYNNNVRIIINGGLNLKGWRMTATPEQPDYFEEFEPEDAEDDLIGEEQYENQVANEQETEANLSDGENSIYEENFITEDIVQTNQEEQTELVEEGYNLSFSITKALQTNITYYVWIKDIYDNVSYQTFSISKKEI